MQLVAPVTQPTHQHRGHYAHAAHKRTYPATHPIQSHLLRQSEKCNHNAPHTLHPRCRLLHVEAKEDMENRIDESMLELNETLGNELYIAQIKELWVFEH